MPASGKSKYLCYIKSRTVQWSCYKHILLYQCNIFRSLRSLYKIACQLNRSLWQHYLPLKIIHELTRERSQGKNIHQLNSIPCSIFIPWYRWEENSSSRFLMSFVLRHLQEMYPYPQSNEIIFFIHSALPTGGLETSSGCICWSILQPYPMLISHCRSWWPWIHLSHLVNFKSIWIIVDWARSNSSTHWFGSDLFC